MRRSLFARAAGCLTAAPVAAQHRHSTTIPVAAVAPGLNKGAKEERKKVLIFNRKAKIAQREAFSQVPVEELKLHKYVAEVMIERLSYVQRDFDTVVEFGCGHGVLSTAFLKSNPRGLKKFIQCDSSQGMLDACFEATCDALPDGVELEQHCVDEGADVLPFPRRSTDLVISSLGFHWINDIEHTLKQIRTMLKQDGVVFVAVFGGKTLAELQSCFTVAEQERDGGVSPHVSPFLTGPTMADLLSNSGFNFPTVDVDKFTFYWDTAFHLMEYLQMIGESNVLMGRREHVGRDVIAATAAVYDRLWYEEGMGVQSTFEVVHGVGWSPHPSHVDSSERGSGRSLSLKDIAESLGEKIMTEEEEKGESLTREEKKETLSSLLQERGMSKERLAHLSDLMEQRTKGDNSPELQTKIHNMRREMQGTIESTEATHVASNLPTTRKETVERRVAYKREEVRQKTDEDEGYSKYLRQLERYKIDDTKPPTDL